MKRRRFFEALTATLLAVLIAAAPAAPAMAQGNSGNNKNKDKDGDGGTEEPVELPPIEYVPIYVPMPNPTSFVGVNDLNDYGVVVGRYFDLETEELRGMIYDPLLAVALDFDPTIAIDLNDLPIVGLDADWIIRSAVGVNNNGLVVGYVTPSDNPAYRRGYVLDFETMIIHELPDQDLADVETYARKVNDSGVIHGQFTDEDGSYYAYLFDPGLRGDAADPVVEVINASINHMSAVMDNPPAGEPTTVTANGSHGVVIQYVKGSQSVAERSDLEGVVYDANDQGDILGLRRGEQYKFRGSTRRDYYAWREIGSVVEMILYSDQNISLWGMNNDGTVLAHVDQVLSLYHDDYGLVDLAALSPDTDFWDFKMNSNGPLGYGQIAGSSDVIDGIVVLTPVETEP